MANSGLCGQPFAATLLALMCYSAPLREPLSLPAALETIRIAVTDGQLQAIGDRRNRDGASPSDREFMASMLRFELAGPYFSPLKSWNTTRTATAKHKDRLLVIGVDGAVAIFSDNWEPLGQYRFALPRDIPRIERYVKPDMMRPLPQSLVPLAIGSLESLVRQDLATSGISSDESQILRRAVLVDGPSHPLFAAEPEIVASGERYAYELYSYGSTGLLFIREKGSSQPQPTKIAPPSAFYQCDIGCVLDAHSLQPGQRMFWRDDFALLQSHARMSPQAAEALLIRELRSATRLHCQSAKGKTATVAISPSEAEAFSRLAKVRANSILLGFGIFHPDDCGCAVAQFHCTNCLVIIGNGTTLAIVPRADREDERTPGILANLGKSDAARPGAVLQYLQYGGRDEARAAMVQCWPISSELWWAAVQKCSIPPTSWSEIHLERIAR